MEQFNLIYETEFLILWLAVPHFMTSILINIKKKKKANPGNPSVCSYLPGINTRQRYKN